jgi:hypothetical protein
MRVEGLILGHLCSTRLGCKLRRRGRLIVLLIAWSRQCTAQGLARVGHWLLIARLLKARLGHCLLIARLLIARLGHCLLIARLGHCLLIALLLIARLGHWLLIARLGHWLLIARLLIASLVGRGKNRLCALVNVWRICACSRRLKCHLGCLGALIVHLRRLLLLSRTLLGHDAVVKGLDSAPALDEPLNQLLRRLRLGGAVQRYDVLETIDHG